MNYSLTLVVLGILFFNLLCLLATYLISRDLRSIVSTLVKMTPENKVSNDMSDIVDVIRFINKLMVVTNITLFVFMVYKITN